STQSAPVCRRSAAPGWQPFVNRSGRPFGPRQFACPARNRPSVQGVTGGQATELWKGFTDGEQRLAAAGGDMSPSFPSRVVRAVVAAGLVSFGSPSFASINQA